MQPRLALVLGAAGRDFHNFNVHFKDNPEYRVAAFTATQIPFINNRTYPTSLAGALYPDGIPIIPEEDFEELIKSKEVTDVYFSYSDVTHLHVMHAASKTLAAGASFHLLGPYDTMLSSSKPVIAVTASRTGAGKSSLVKRIVKLFSIWGLRCTVIRHPMPYRGFDHPVQRFESLRDLERYDLTWEEREEYEALIGERVVTFAGVDYRQILVEAEKEAPLIVWDGGNNDFPFYRPTLHITVVDALRPGDEVNYHPGETNLRMADIIAVNKINTAPKENVQKILDNCRSANPDAQILLLNSEPYVDRPELVRGKRVLVVEDGPTVTHGEMGEAGGALAARLLGASLVDPRRHAVGSISEVFDRYPKIGSVLPALGYSAEQLHELELTINAVDCDSVLLATPASLERTIKIQRPTARVRFEVSDVGGLKLDDLLRSRLEKIGGFFD